MNKQLQDRFQCFEGPQNHCAQACVYVLYPIKSDLYIFWSPTELMFTNGSVVSYHKICILSEQIISIMFRVHQNHSESIYSDLSKFYKSLKSNIMLFMNFNENLINRVIIRWANYCGISYSRCPICVNQLQLTYFSFRSVFGTLFQLLMTNQDIYVSLRYVMWSCIKIDEQIRCQKI